MSVSKCLRHEIRKSTPSFEHGLGYSTQVCFAPCLEGSELGKLYREAAEVNWNWASRAERDEQRGMGGVR